MSIMLPDTPWCIDTPAERATPRTVHRTTCPGPADGKVVPLHNMTGMSEDDVRQHIAPLGALRLCPVCLPDPDSGTPGQPPRRGNTLRVYRLDVEYPPGSREPGWQPPGWEEDWNKHPEFWGAGTDPELDEFPPFRWPRTCRYLSKSGAGKRAKVLRRLGAGVTVVPSKPVEWEDSP